MGSFATETHNFKEPTNRSLPIRGRGHGLFARIKQQERERENERERERERESERERKRERESLKDLRSEPSIEAATMYGAEAIASLLE